MKIRTAVDVFIIPVVISVILVSIKPLSVCAFAKDSGTSNGKSSAKKPAWLDGAGKDLRIKIRGEALGEKGKPENGCKLHVLLKSRFFQQDLPVVMEGNRFEFWVPVGKAGWMTLHLNATSADGQLIVRKMVNAYEIRQAAIEGLKLKMEKLQRMVAVTVVADGKPVPGAFVAAEFTGMRLMSKTNDAGVAKFAAMKCDNLSQLTAWTDDFMLGGYSFSRKPPRDPKGDKFTIELDKCRSQMIRFINEEDQKPVADLNFLFTVGSGPPDYQYPGKTPDCEMKTDKNGEAVFRRFPNWDKHGSYVECLNKRWIKAGEEETVDGVIVVKMKKSRIDKRRRVVGQVKSADGNVAGFYVRMMSFQAEEKNHVDGLHAFTDECGKFEADYLPAATYCVYINDAQFVSNMVDLIPYEPTAGKTNTPSLEVTTGQPVEVVATSGPNRRPLAHQSIHMRTSHGFSWREGGKTRHGQSGRAWYVTTDENGKARTFALPGKEIVGSIYSTQWRAEQKAQVKASGVTRLEFHQKVAAKRKIVGQLFLEKNKEADLNDTVVEIGSVDGETRERLTLATDSKGRFEFESQASLIGIYAHTKDLKAAVVSIIDRLDKPIELQLKPTGQFHGQLLGKENRPLADRAVRASLYVTKKRDFTSPFPTGFSAATFESKTDSEGNYTILGLPREAKLSLRVDPIDGSDRTHYLADFYLMPNESRPRTVSRLWKPKKKPLSFVQRYEKNLRDCRLSNFHAMVILFRPSDDTKKFVNVNLMDYEKTKEVSSFMQLQGDGSANTEIAELAKEKNWPQPEPGKVFVCALDARGKELGRIEFDPKDPQSQKQAAQFVRKHAPKRVDAKKKWDEAFATAKQTGRKVWVRVSQRYCGPCFMLARWLDDQKATLQQDYVLLKIDDVRDAHGFEVAKRLTGDEHYGVPFHAIFDADGKMLISSNSVVGNIGHPSGFEGKRHLRKMLMSTRNKLTDKQIDEIVASLSD
ncbi:MAG: thioredoxin family protein [Pirellulales bacterium]|nr:thioredoxin family protein [Pirellulales bacterium]